MVSLHFLPTCNANVFLFDGSASSVEEYKQSLLKLKGMEGQYDRVYFSHGPVEREKSILNDCLKVCDEILEGKDDKVPFILWGFMPCRRKRGILTDGQTDGWGILFITLIGSDGDHRI